MKSNPLKDEMSRLAAEISRKISVNASDEELLKEIQSLYEKSILYKHSLGKKQDPPDLFTSVPEQAAPPPAIEEPVSQPEDKPLSRPVRASEDLIGINDRFRFMNELFGGSAKEFNIVLGQLNVLPCPKETELYLNSIKSVYGWEEDNPAMTEFFSIVKKRFA